MGGETGANDGKLLVLVCVSRVNKCDGGVRAGGLKYRTALGNGEASCSRRSSGLGRGEMQHQAATPNPNWCRVSRLQVSPFRAAVDKGRGEVKTAAPAARIPPRPVGRISKVQLPRLFRGPLLITVCWLQVGISEYHGGGWSSGDRSIIPRTSKLICSLAYPCCKTEQLW